MKLKKDFHPRLLGFAGISGAGKTTLIEKIIKTMKDFSIGYIKHDAHKFEIDHPGKDSYRQYHAGAQMVYINDSEHFCLQGRGQSYSLEKEYFKDSDFVLVEGHKYSDHPKFLFLDPEGKALGEYREGKITHVLGFIQLEETQECPEELPAFHRDDVAGVIDFIKKHFLCSTPPELCGLILTGGRSQRMGTDKSLIHYHNKPQARYLYELVETFGMKTFLSCRKEQLDRQELSHLPSITDRFIDFGPLGGILSAMTSYPDKAWLVIACDLPLITFDKIQELIEARNYLKQATAYFNEERKQFEPLFAIYEPRIYSRMLHFLGEGVTCPQKVLFNSSIKKLSLKSQGQLENANTPEDHTRILQALEVGNL
jgi:molybdopterin-guanine dinucleotide biosynthesis protein A